MFRPILRQLLYAAALILAVLVLNFLLIQLAPGDPAEVIAGEMVAPAPRSWPRSASNTGWTSRC